MALVVPASMVPECTAQLAEHMAEHDTHGYSQPNRNGDGTLETVTLEPVKGIFYKVKVHGGDYDCSSMVAQILVALGVLKSGTHVDTRNEDEVLRRAGFTRMAYDPSRVRRGDILWVKGHTGIALGNGKQADAHGDEVGGLTGPRKGDQTGHEVEIRSLRSWTYIYRYGKGSSGPAVVSASFRVTAGTERNARYKPDPSNDAYKTGTLKPGESVVCYGFTYANGLAWGVYLNYAGKVRYIALEGSVTVS